MSAVASRSALAVQDRAAVAAMEVTPLLGTREIYGAMIQHLLKAERQAVFVLWCCDFLTPMHEDKPLTHWLEVALTQNPYLRVQFVLHDNAYNLYPKGCYQEEPRIHIQFVSPFNSGVGLWLYRALSPKKSTRLVEHDRERRVPGSGKNCLHQKYVLFDEDALLFVGTDIRDVGKGRYPFEPNDSGWYWDEMSFLIRKPTARMVDFLRENANQGGEPSRDTESIPYPFINQFSHPMREEEVYVDLIRHSKHYVEIENQYWYTSNWSQNRIGLAVVERIKRAIQEGDRQFRVIVLVNWSMKDETNELNKLALQSSICASLLFTRMQLSQLEKVDWHDYLYIGYLYHLEEDRKIYIHTKRLIVDGKHVILSSSNLCDRSMARDESDIELGIYLRDRPDVATCAQKRAWDAHTNLHKVPAERRGDFEWDYLLLFEMLKWERQKRRATAWQPAPPAPELLRARIPFLDDLHTSYCALEDKIPDNFEVRAYMQEVFNAAFRFI